MYYSRFFDTGNSRNERKLKRFEVILLDTIAQLKSQNVAQICKLKTLVDSQKYAHFTK